MACRAGPPLRRRPPPRPALLALAVLSCLQLAASQLSSTSTRPLARPAATAAVPLEEAAAGGGGVARRACTYTVEIKTSCSSPRASPDAVSLAFGDAYRNEVYTARVSPAYGFERCAKDTFRVSGPCGYGVCYLYLRRSGGVGWTPQWVRVYEPASRTPSTFYFGDPLPNGVWYGLDRCLRRPAPGAGAGASPDAAAQASQ
ncbi:embryo-specific protein ATS3A-like [Panicum virgatum]|nr:embryo-specific protein ATS3A-like [Panicum virgatum]